MLPEKRLDFLPRVINLLKRKQSEADTLRAELESAEDEAYIIEELLRIMKDFMSDLDKSAESMQGGVTRFRNTVKSYHDQLSEILDR